jgi:hypothetical protein
MMAFVGLFWIAIGLWAFCAALLNLDPHGKWPANAFWDALLGQRLANVLTMVFGAVAIIAGLVVVILALC